MNLLPLANRIQAARLGTKNKDLFLQMFPAEAESAVLLREPLDGTPIDAELPGFYKAKFQVIVRAHDYESGADKIKKVVDLLTFQNLEIGTQTFNFCRPCHLPVAYPLSRGNLVEYSVKFDACYLEK